MGITQSYCPPTMRQHPHAAIAGLTIVTFTWLGEQALSIFHILETTYWWAPLILTPLSTAAIVWITRRFVPGAAGSGIPQVMAALEPEAHGSGRRLFVSLKLSFAKMLLTVWGVACRSVFGA